MLAQEGFHEYGNIFPAVAQRRKVQTDSVDPVVELGAKTSRAHFIVQVSAGSGDYPRTDHSTLRIGLPIWERVQKIALASRVQLADFIENHAARRSQT